MEIEVFKQLGSALALAMIIGLEREHRYQLAGYRGFSGMRTNTLMGLFGAAIYTFFGDMPYIFASFVLGFCALIVAAYIVTSKKSKDAGATSEISAFLVFVVGILCGMQEYLVATVMCLVIITISYFKRPMHKWAKKVKHVELMSTMQFMLITFVILPLLPNASFGPYEFFNPYIVWLMVVLVSGISFASYIAIKIFGTKKGIALTGFLAGFISSTALTYSLSRQSNQYKKVQLPFMMAVVIAVTGVYFRVIFEVAVVNSELLSKLLVPLLAMGGVGVLASVRLFVKHEPVPAIVEKKAVEMKSPFTLGPAINFAILFAFVLFLTKFMATVVGASALHVTSFITGFLDIDSIVISNARLALDGDISETTASVAITLAVIANTLAKAAIFFFFGNKIVSKRLFLNLLPVVVIGLVATFFL